MRRNWIMGGLAALVLAIGVLVAGMTSSPAGAVDSSIEFPPFPTTATPIGQPLTLQVTLSHSGSPVDGTVVTWAVVSGPNVGMTGTVTSDSAGIATFDYTGSAVGMDMVTAYFVDADGDTAAANPIAQYWIPTAPATLVLDQSADSNPVGAPHTVTATVTDSGGAPIADVPVELTSTPLFITYVRNTDLAGTATFEFTRTEPGEEFLTARIVGGGVGGNELIKTWTPIGSLQLQPTAAINSLGPDHTVSALALDAAGLPVADTVISFEVEGANPTVSDVTTDATGNAVFSYAGAALGFDSIAAGFVDPDGNLVRAVPVQKVWAPGTGAFLAVYPPAADNPTLTNHQITATAVKDLAPVAGVAVTFEVTAGPNTGVIGTATTDAMGNAHVSYRSTNPGEDTIVAHFLDGTTTVTSDPVAKTWHTTAILTLTPEAATNPVGDIHTVTATLKDAEGGPIPGAAVQVWVDGANRPGTDGPYEVLTTDAAGVAEFTYLGLFEGTDSIDAQVYDPEAGRYAEAALVTKEWIQGGPAATLTLTPESAENPVGAEHTVTATLTGDGSPVAGVEVAFEVTSGPNTGESATATTDAAGLASFAYTGDAGAGTDTIKASATVDGVEVTSNEVTKTWVDEGPTVTLTLAPESAENPLGTEHTVTATLSDGDTPLEGVEVTFEVTEGPQAGASGTATTDAAGQATFTFYGDSAGTDTIVASATVDAVEVRSNEVTKVWLPRIPAVVQLMPEVSENPVGSEHEVDAIVSNSEGLAVPDIEVTFTVVSGPHAGTTGSMITTSTGTAGFAYTGTDAGTDTIVASVTWDGITTLSNEVTKTWVDGGAFDVVRLRVLWGPAGQRSLAYENGGTLTAGDYVIDPETGEPTAIDGTGTLPSSSGSGDATIAFHLTFDEGANKWEGTVEIDDPGADFAAVIPVFAGPQRITRHEGRTMGTLYGIKRLSTPEKCFELHFVIDDENRPSGEPPEEAEASMLLAGGHLRIPARWAQHMQQSHEGHRRYSRNWARLPG